MFRIKNDQAYIKEKIKKMLINYYEYVNCIA